jgi:hypothetical protein
MKTRTGTKIKLVIKIFIGLFSRGFQCGISSYNFSINRFFFGFSGPFCIQFAPPPRFLYSVAKNLQLMCKYCRIICWLQFETFVLVLLLCACKCRLSVIDHWAYWIEIRGCLFKICLKYFTPVDYLEFLRSLLLSILIFFFIESFILCDLGILKVQYGLEDFIDYIILVCHACYTTSSPHLCSFV